MGKHKNDAEGFELKVAAMLKGISGSASRPPRRSC